MKALIFDMDGLMIDSERLYFQAEREMALRLGKKVKDKTLWNMMGRNPRESLEVFKQELHLTEDVETLLEKRNDLMRQKLQLDLQAMPGLHFIINTFHCRLKLAVCTGAQSEFLDITVDQLGIRKRFSILQSSDEIKNGKPDPEIYLTTCRLLQTNPSECIVLEDSSNGCRAGRRAGCYIIAVPSEYTRTQDFSFVDFTASDLFQAERHISALLKNF